MTRWSLLASRCIAIVVGASSVLPRQGAAQQVPVARVVSLPVSLELGSILWALPLSGQRVIFADQSSQLVFIRQPDGSTKQLGRHGDGPGEYRAPEYGVLKGDSILILTPGRFRRHALHLDAGTGTTRLLNGVAPDASCRVLTLLSSEGVCELPRRGDPRDAGHFRTFMRFTTDADTRELTPLYQYHDTAYVARLLSGTTTLHLERPVIWGPSGSLSPSATTSFVLEQSAVGARVAVTVTMTDVANGRRTMHRFDAAQTPVSTSAVRAEARRVVAEFGTEGHPMAADQALATSQLVAAWSVPQTAPPYKRVRGSDDGCVWLERSRALGAALPATVVHDRYDAAGRTLGAVAVPLNLFLHSVTCGMAIGSRTDENGVPELVRVEVTRAR